ncbi:MAG: outer membrane beta-barrel protein [Gammaproteobacteria bacterium]|nr:outer membrane beta-barrel protein [Gammaproteobacteria bacterium]MBV9696349.1 outer membrane beta-barrel protein [Gammaproteobacteria bacterium]
MRILPLAALLAVGIGAGSAHAADTGVPPNLLYIGAGISNNQVDDITHTGVPFSKINKTAWKVFAGVRPIPWLGAEVNYMDLGNRTDRILNGTPGVGAGTFSHSDARAFAAYGVGFLPLPADRPFLDLYGKAGVARWRLSGSSDAGTLPPTSSGFYDFTDRGTSFAWGLGAQAHLGNFGGRLEWERFRIANTSGARVWTLGLVFSLF